MSREVFEGNYKTYWLTACGNIAAPTAAEIAAGTYVGTLVTKDGVALNVTENAVDIASIDTTFDAQIGGSWGMKPELTFFRDGATDTAWNLAVKGTEGFLLIAYFGSVAVGQKCAVIPSEMGVAKPTNSATNEPQKFTQSFFTRSEPNLKATVA